MITLSIPESPTDCRTAPLRNVDYQQQRVLLQRIDQLITQSGLDTAFVAASLTYHQQHRRHTPMTPAEQARFAVTARQALRCHLLRTLTQDSLRQFSADLVSHTLWRDFCGCVDTPPPSKSQLWRYAQWLPEPAMRALAICPVQQAASPDGAPRLALATGVDLGVGWGDSTGLPTPIHVPVDWLLVRDAVRTLTKSIAVIRRHGLCARMREPASFRTVINRLCIRMTQEKRPDRPTAKKRVGRALLRTLKLVEAHARRHLSRLQQAWEQTTLSPRQAGRIADRITGVLAQLPTVRTQLTTRLLQEQPVANADKLLSLYEPTTQVLVRGKPGGQIEYGHPLWLVENRDGLVLDWALAETLTADPTLAEASLPRLTTAYAGQVRTLVTDRGCDGPGVRHALETAGMTNAVGPRSPKRWQTRGTDPLFRAMQRRRSQTEARIAIVKRQFLGTPLRVRGFPHQACQVAWAVLTHNLWVLARLPVATALPAAA
jgi:IS5 family transposase